MDGMEREKKNKKRFFSPPYLANWTLLAEGKTAFLPPKPKRTTTTIPSVGIRNRSASVFVVEQIETTGAEKSRVFFIRGIWQIQKLHLAPLSRLHATVFFPPSPFTQYLFTKEGGSGSWKNLPIFFDGKRRGGSHKGRNFYWTTFLPSFIDAAIWLTNDGASSAKAGFPNRKRRKKKTFSVYRTITQNIVWDESETPVPQFFLAI